MGPKHNLVHFKYLFWCLYIKSWSNSHHLYAGKRCNGNPISTQKKGNWLNKSPLVLAGQYIFNVLELFEYLTLPLGLVEHVYCPWAIKPLNQLPDESSPLSCLPCLVCLVWFGLDKKTPSFLSDLMPT